MLYVKIPALEGFDESKDEFVDIKPAVTLQLEHSLKSISKWEAKWKKPFFLPEKKTQEETISYIRCMTINKDVTFDVYSRISNDQLRAIFEYMEDSHTATTIADSAKKSRHITTSEEIYYAMFFYGIPIECEKWHINNLFMLLRIASIKGQPSQKKSPSQIMQEYEALNAARRALTGSKG